MSPRIVSAPADLGEHVRRVVDRRDEIAHPDERMGDAARAGAQFEDAAPRRGDPGTRSGSYSALSCFHSSTEQPSRLRGPGPVPP